MSLLTYFNEEKQSLKRAARTVALFSLAASLCYLIVPVYLLQIYDRVLSSRSVETLIALSFIAVVVLCAYAILDAARHVLLSQAAVRFESGLAGPLLAAELAHTNDASAQSIKDLATVRAIIASPTVAHLFDLPMMPIFVLIVFLVHPFLGFIVVLGIGILLMLTLFGEKASAPHLAEANQRGIHASRALDMHMGQQEIIRASGMYRESVKDWGNYQGKFLSSYLQMFKWTSLFSSISKASRQIIQIALIGSGAALVLADQATPGVIFAASIIGSRALAPIEAIIGGWRNLRQAMAALKRLEERMDDLSLPLERTPLPKSKGRINFDRLAYMPKPGMPPILKGIGANIPAGTAVAIIGPSGAGKSTLAKLLVGYLDPIQGKVSLDGQDLRAWDPVIRGLNIGYMPQMVTFFDATVRDNIARLRREDPPERVLEVARFVGIHDLILDFPQGYDTPISRELFQPSGGQRQLLGLARAFYGDPSVVVLDEPNANLDEQGERMLHETLRRAKARGITTIVVTQRPSLLQFVDNVMILQDGQIKAYGPRDEVMKSKLIASVPGKAGKPGAPKKQQQTS